jgi:proline iminopeptidase
MAVGGSTAKLAQPAALFVGAYALAARPILLRWGASDGELRDPYPGADLIPGAKRGATMATTIEAPPSRVWPWLVQMGCDRAGWYSWDRLDNAGAASAREIHPEWQHIEVGSRLASTPSGNAYFEVAAVEPERFLALRARLDLRGRPFDASGPRPRCYVDSLWGFLLNELPGERTRLVVGGYAASHPRPLTWIGDVLFWEPAHWIMQTRQFANLKRRTEHEGARAS